MPLRLKREEFSRIAFRTGSSFRSPRFGTVTASSMKPSAIIIPPAATNGIMYDTPVITACCMRLPQPSCAPSASADASALPLPPVTLYALGFFDAATASSIIFLGSLMARFTPDSITGLPTNRSRSFTPTSVAKITASAASMTSDATGVTAEEPCVSTTSSTPSISSAVWVRESAAM